MQNYQSITNVMTKKVVTLNDKDTLEKAEFLFKKNNIRHIPVVKDNKIVGMLSYNDLLRISFADAYNTLETEADTLVYNMFTIKQVMTKNLVHVNSKATIKEVAEIFYQKEFHALPVVDNGTLVGIITTTDLMKYLIDNLE